MRWIRRSISSGDLADVVGLLVGGLERRAPDRLPLRLVEIGEIFGEADDQVHLGEDGIDREVDLQLLVQFVEAPADRVGVRRDLRRRQVQNIGDADRDDHAVDRLARAVPAQHVEEGEPASAVGLGVRILGRVAPGGVDQHRLVGEPPVAIARAPDALDRLARVVSGERKLQAGIDQRRRLARAGRADDEIPGQIVEGARARLAGALERRERVLHLLLQDRRVAVLGRRLGHRLARSWRRPGGAQRCARR